MLGIVVDQGTDRLGIRYFGVADLHVPKYSKQPAVFNPHPRPDRQTERRAKNEKTLAKPPPATTIAPIYVGRLESS
jgi:hypothetical protein